MCRNIQWVGIVLFQICFCQLLFAALPVTEGLVLHLDAGDLALADGTAVASWDAASQATASAQPVYVANDSVFNSLPVVRFDGIDDWMALPSPAPFNVGSVTMFAVGKFIPDGSNQYMVAGQDGGGDDRIRISIDGGFEYRIGSSGWRAVNTGAIDENVHIFEILSTAEGFLDGAGVGTAANSSTETPVALNIGSYNRGEKDFLSGDLAELIIFNRVLTTGERNEVGAYLETKYALTTDYAGVNPQVHTPIPSDGSQNIPLDAVLSFQSPAEVDNPVYDVYFGVSNTVPVLVSEGQTETTFDPYGSDLLQPGQAYNWRVDIQGGAQGSVWSFTTRSESLASLQADMNEDSVVDILDLKMLSEWWLSTTSAPVNIDQSGKIDMKDYASVSSMWKKNGPAPAGYVISRCGPADFKVADADEITMIYVDSADYTVCQIAAECLADDIAQICGTKPAIVHSLEGLSGHVIFIGTLGRSAAIDTLAADSKINVSDVTGQWETFALEVVDSPVASVDRGLVIVGSDRRGTAFGVFDLSEKMGVSPWFWWADVPVRFREQIIVRDGRYKEGPPSVKYRGIFINDEDWGLHPWSKYTYSPEDGYIGPKTYQKVFELLLRLKANHIWPAMHGCTKAFNAFEANKVIADEYAIVMGSSHCEQMLRNNVWEWYRWSPSDGSSRGNWDWCTNSTKITEYWQDRVKVNATYENVYTTGMRGIHDGSMPCSGASSAQKVWKMENEVFPAQRQMLADWVNPDPSKVPQIFCPYKEVLGLYDMNMQVPDDIILAWPDDNHGYIRRLSNSAEQGRSGRAGVYYHLSYWGSPHDYLWLSSIGPGLIWEEMKKAHDYGADQVWIFNVGDIKPAEISMEFALQMAWDINRWNHTNLQQYLEQWAWREFGPKHKTEIAEILADYYRLGLTRKPEHMASGGAAFSLIHYNDEAQRRIDAYKTLEEKASAVYQSLASIYKDAFYQLVLYPVRGASLMNQKILYAKKSQHYASQGRVSANEYAAMSQAAYNQIITETDFYNNSVANGKWKHMMSYNPRGQSVFGQPAISTVQPVNGASMGIVLEGQTVDIADMDSGQPAAPFDDDFSDGSADGWQPTTTARWEVRSNGAEMEYAINTTDYDSLSGSRLGEMSLIEGHLYENFNFSCQARSCDNFAANSSSDLAIVFGYINENNYNYLILSSNGSNSVLYRVAGGVRSAVTMASGAAIPDNNFYLVEIEKRSSQLTIRYRNQVILSTNETFAGGLIGVGSYNDSSAFTDIDITPLEGDPSVSFDLLPQFNVFTKDKYFIDIFNKGDTAFSWTAVPSAAWIQLDQTGGTVDAQQRIWVSLDWDQVPLGQNNGTIEIAGAGTNVSVKLAAFNPVSPRPDDIQGFVSSNGCVSMEAESYSNKIDKNNAGWETIGALGRTGDTMTILPTTTPSRDMTADILVNSPLLEYEVHLWDAGDQKVMVYCIPTHAITSEHGLRYAVAFDDQTPQIVEYDTAEWSAQWKLNVLQGAAISESSHTLSQPGQHTLKIWMVDPGVVLDKIVIGSPKSSHLAPPETRVPSQTR